MDRRLPNLGWTRLFRAALVALVLSLGAFSATPARAEDVDEEIDARFVGYEGNKNVAIPKSSSTIMYLLLLVLIIVGCVPLFKGAKRVD